MNEALTLLEWPAGGDDEDSDGQVDTRPDADDDARRSLAPDLCCMVQACHAVLHQLHLPHRRPSHFVAGSCPEIVQDLVMMARAIWLKLAEC